MVNGKSSQVIILGGSDLMSKTKAEIRTVEVCVSLFPFATAPGSPHNGYSIVWAKPSNLTGKSIIAQKGCERDSI